MARKKGRRKGYTGPCNKILKEGMRGGKKSPRQMSEMMKEFWACRGGRKKR